jgi:hypothetical protein
MKPKFFAITALALKTLCVLAAAGVLFTACAAIFGDFFNDNKPAPSPGGGKAGLRIENNTSIAFARVILESAGEAAVDSGDPVVPNSEKTYPGIEPGTYTLKLFDAQGEVLYTHDYTLIAGSTKRVTLDDEGGSGSASSKASLTVKNSASYTISKVELQAGSAAPITKTEAIAPGAEKTYAGIAPGT